MVRSLAILVLILQGAACGLFGPDEERRRGRILEGNDNEVPDSVRLGQPFEVTIFTYGSCTSGGDEVVTWPSPDTAKIEPYDIVDVSGDYICPSALLPIPHAVSLTFDVPGEAFVVVIGYGYQSNLSELEYPIWVH